MHLSVAFAEVARAMAGNASAIHPAEAHGCLCGALCLRPDYSLPEWLDEILPDAAASGGGSDVFGAVFSDTAGALARPDMEFEPLLPDDDASLAERVESLAAWCQGFLYGFGASGNADRSALPETVREVLADLAQICHAGAVGSESADVEEDAFSELVEFVRAAVQLAYDDLAPARARLLPPQSGH
jgi:hypothetical protein